MLENMKKVKMMEEIKMQIMKTPLRMHLQRYTEGGGAGGAGDGGGQGGSGDGNQGGAGDGGQAGDGGTDKPITFETQEALDAHITAAVTKAVNDAKATWATETQQQIDNAKTEAQKMAGMTDEQKAAYQVQKQEDDLAKREAEITKRELEVKALKYLTEKELPEELIGTVVLTDAETCMKSLEAIEKSFSKAVEKAVNKRLADSAEVPGGAGTGGNGKNEPGSFGKRLAERQAQKEQKKSAYFKK